MQDNETNTQKLPKLAIAAIVVAFLLAISGFLGAIREPLLILSALVPVTAGIVILRRRVWGAYGFALFELAQGIVVPLALFSNTQARDRMQLLVAAVIGVGLAILFFFAGRSLARAGAQRGARWPWIAIACLFALPFFFVRAYVIPTDAMEDTLLIGDHIVVRVFPRGTPARGNVVAFHYPVDRRQIFVKRVIGVPGDHIRMVSRVLYRNGIELKEPYVVQRFPADSYRDNAPSDPSGLRFLPEAVLVKAKEMYEHHVQNGEIVVPPGKYFVLGDNRDNSLDSRYWGFLDASDIIGKPLFIYQSEEQNRAGKTRERWDRILKIMR